MNPLYILPNLFTAGSILIGIISIISATKGLFVHSAWLILLAMIFDGLDGRVARLTNTTSKFGIELDSLADIVSFGVAPAMLVYFYVGNYYGNYGTAISALFVIFGALRLARFNVSTTNADPYNFIGLPIPSAAVFVSFLVIFGEEFIKTSYFLDYEIYGICVMVLAFFAAVLMVSNIRYPSFKKVSWNFKSYTLAVMLLLFIFIKPSIAMSTLMSCYILYGVIRSAILLGRAKLKKH